MSTFKPCAFTGKEQDDVFILRDSIRGQTVLNGKIEKISNVRGDIRVTTTLGMYNAREFGKTIFLSKEELLQ